MPESFHGSSLPDVMKKVRANLGPDAMILRTAVRPGRGGDIVEIVAAPASEVESLRSRLRGPAPRPRETGRDGGRPESYRIAFVGPGGAGKTTALVKLALAAASAPDRRPRPVGILTLDTWRAGALEELTTWADVLGVPLEVVDSVAEIPQALESLARCDVLLIDTPGCGHGTPAPRRSWWPILEALRPHEVHAAVPAPWRTEVARATVRALEGVHPTHLLVTQLDAAPGDRAMVELVRTLDMPVRWVTDSPEHSVVVKPASSRILSSLEVERKGTRSPATANTAAGAAATATPRGACTGNGGTYRPGARTAATNPADGSGAPTARPPAAPVTPRPSDEPRIPLPNVYPFTRAG